MTTVSTPEAVSSRSSHSPAIEVEEPRKKSSRHGKRFVTHLSKDQLARKRAHDREAQRNLRQRTKEHIENLENKVKELDGGGRSSSMERVLKRNRELESEVERLRSQLSSLQSSSPQILSGMPEHLYTQPRNELQWIPDQGRQWPETISSHMLALDPNVELPVSMAMAQTNYGTSDPSFQPSNMQYGQDLYHTTATPISNDPAVFGRQQQSQALSKPTASWAPFHPAFSHPSRFADLQQSGLTELVNNPYSANTTCWQSEPRVYA